MFASGAPYRVGIRPQGKDRRFWFYYNIDVEPLRAEVHEVERSLNLLRRIGVDIGEKRLVFKLFEENKKEAMDFLSKHNMKRDRSIVGVNFSRRVEEGRDWKYENHVALIKRFKSNGLQVVASCGPEEGTLVEDLLKTSHCKVPLYWSESLKNFAAVVEQCSVFVSVDGGPTHVAAAVGTPVVALFGKGDVRGWAPWGKHHKVLKKGNDLSLIHVDDVFEVTQGIIEAMEGPRDDLWATRRGVI